MDASTMIELLWSSDAEGKRQAATVLKNLAGNNAEIQKAIAKAGAIEPLIELLRSSDTAGRRGEEACGEPCWQQC